MDYKGEVSVLKDTGTPEFLQDLRRYDTHVNINSRVLLGHNRHMTIGANTRHNAHPFIAGDRIIGAHNGTINTRHRIEGYKDYETDSEALYNAIARDGLEPTIAKLQGSWALSWIDLDGSKHGPTINFLRNAERSLALAMTEDKRVLFWMSEREMLQAVITRHSIKLTSDGVFNIKTNTWFKWVIPFGTSRFSKPGISEVVHDTTPFQSYSGYQGNLPGLGHRPVATLGPSSIGPGTKDSDIQAKTPNEQQKPNEKPSESDLMKKAGLVDTKGKPLSSETSDSDSQSKPSSTVRPLSDEYYSGYYCGTERGQKVQDCPHIGTTQEARDWRKGFLEGRKSLNSKGLKSANVKPLYITGPKGSMDEKEFRKLTGCTCAWCDNVVQFGDHVEWVSNDSFICEECSKGSYGT
jgi:hypothetical protein